MRSSSNGSRNKMKSEEILALKVRAANRALVYKAKMDLLYLLCQQENGLTDEQKTEIDNQYKALDKILDEQGYE